MKSSYFSVDRALTDQEWEELSAWRKANPDARWQRKDTRDGGKVFWQYARKSPNGEYWSTLEAIESAYIRGLEAKKKAYAANPEKLKEKSLRRYHADPEPAKARMARWQAKNKHRVRETQSKWREENRHRLRARHAEWRRDNAEWVRQYAKENIRRRRASDPLQALRDRVRRRTRTALYSAGYSKSSKTGEILGCSWEELMEHMEKKFTDGMTWENRSLWHIDHVIPLASAKTEEELVALCHYTNLQPLWAFDNLSKGCKLPA